MPAVPELPGDPRVMGMDRDPTDPADPAERTDPTGDTADGAEAPWERPIDKFRRTTTGTVVAAGLLGLRDAMEGRPEKEEVTIVSEAPTRPVGDLDIVLDPDHPERTVAIVRRPSPDQAPDDAPS